MGLVSESCRPITLRVRGGLTLLPPLDPPGPGATLTLGTILLLVASFVWSIAGGRYAMVKYMSMSMAATGCT